MKNSLKNKPNITFETPQVKDVVVEATKEELVIKTGAKNATSPWFFILFSFLIVWLAVGFWLASTTPSDAMLIIFAIGLAVVVGALFYLLIATFLNKTIITVTPDTLTVEQKPLPTGFRTKRYAVSEIKSIKVGTRVILTSHSTHRFHTVQLILRKGWNRKQNIVGGFKTPTEPTYIVEMMQEFLS